MSEQNGWISIDDARFTLSKYVGGEIVIRTKANNGRWAYHQTIGKIAIYKGGVRRGKQMDRNR